MLVSMMLLTVGTTAALVYVPWALVSRRNIDTIVGQVNQEIAVGTSQEVERLFSNAQSAQQLLQSSLGEGLISLNDPQDRERFLLRVLQANPDFTWVQYGDADGDFLGAQRTPDGQLRFHLRDWNSKAKETTATIRTYRPDGERLKQIQSETLQMDPPFYAPERPWYKSAVARPSQPNWTVYVYRSTNTPGLDASVTLKRDDELLGVIAVGIELRQLSEHLRRLQGSRGGESFIINARYELIASSDVQEVGPAQASSQDEPHLRQLSATANPLLHYASQTLKPKDSSGVSLDDWQRFVYKDPQTGNRYFITLTPLDQLDWAIGTVIPEASYLAEINRNKQILLVMIVVFTGVTAGAAVLLADRFIARPVLGIAHAARAIESECFELDRLGQIAQRGDEIGQLARVFKRMAQEVYSREQQLKQQVRDLRIEVDEARRSRHVQEIVETDFFQNLVIKAKALRSRDSRNRQG